ncbi:sensor histidine kinase [Litoreibacter roseus]|uniref:histidine kinase n=1 Tax=Litoreibacter roseus TaxID=2601869 RepID=A0A6N6JG58_9RHOB|nr:sensor histidine kinase [Litoreibacter roseus]GFE65331.1 histidine kinase [Litoreibacter roseus]
MKRAASLRTRLTVIILAPLLFIATVLGLFEYQDAQDRTSTRLDRMLLSTALAVTRDVASSDGEALSFETLDLLQDASIGLVYYHVYAPDGSFVIGYATPPVRDPGTELEEAEVPYSYFEGTYQNRQVRALQLRERMQIAGLSGEFTFTVWQDIAVRNNLLRAIATRTFTGIAILIATVALVVWFGIRLGLRPLADLEEAIALRSPDDLAPIRRPVPREVRGVTATLNTLLDQVSATMQEKTDFISNAAHQLRNPIAGIQAMAEAVSSARDLETSQSRSKELLDAARHAGDLAEKMLTYERASALALDITAESIDLNTLVSSVVRSVTSGSVELTYTPASEPAWVTGDALMLGEALRNLIDNALTHGGLGLSKVEVIVLKTNDGAELIVRDNGQGIPSEDIDIVLERFSQPAPAQGSGLGLPIAQTVAKQHGGRLTLDPSPDGLTVKLHLPSARQDD